MINLTNDEIFRYCDPLLLKYMLTMMINDSSSYLFINNDELDKINNLEFRKTNQKSVYLWYEKF